MGRRDAKRRFRLRGKQTVEQEPQQMVRQQKQQKTKKIGGQRRKKPNTDDVEIIGMTPCSSYDLNPSSYGLQPEEFYWMLVFGVPIALFNILYVLAHTRPTASTCSSTSIDFIEFFSGCGQIRDAMIRRGHNACGYDIGDHSTYENLNGAHGLLCAIQLMRLLRTHGGLHWATVCSSWVWICRKTSKRSLAFPLGIPPQCKSVLAGNMMVSNMAVLTLWALSKKCSWVLEQPATSLMFQHPRLKQAKAILATINDPRFSFTAVDMCMGAFGSNSNKPSALVASSPWIRGLDVPLSAEDKLRIAENTEEIVVRDDNGGITGGKDLKGTQEYPRGYGEAVAKEWSQFLRDPMEVSDDEPNFHFPQPTTDTWEDTSLHMVCQMLGVPSHVLLT